MIKNEEFILEKDVAMSGFLELRQRNMHNNSLYFPLTLRKVSIVKKGENYELTFSFDPEGRLFKDKYADGLDCDPLLLGERATVEQQLEGLATVIDGRIVTKNIVHYSVWKAVKGRWDVLILNFSTLYIGSTFETMKAKNKRVFQK